MEGCRGLFVYMRGLRRMFVDRWKGIEGDVCGQVEGDKWKGIESYV